jgi:cell division protein FtsZ
LGARIKVIGIGGGGGSAVNTMIGARLWRGFHGCQYRRPVAGKSQAVIRAVGGMVTKGLGAGANPEIGRKAALEDKERIEYLSGST